MLPLDKSDTNVCDVDELIEKLIVNNLSRHIHYSKKFLIEVLHRQKCLMMLDGLDKWIHPDNCSLCRTDHIPKRRIRPHCTFITATSLWKFNALSLKDTQIDKHVNICALDENTSTELITKAVDALNDRCIHKMSVEEIKSKISSFKIDRNLRFNPFNILQLTCMLFDGKYIGSTKCELYCSMINLTLARYSDKLRSLKLNSSTLLQCPPCLMHHDECKRNFKFPLCIGELAFTKLFSKGSSAVFDLATVSEYMPNKTLEMCLKLGILTQNKIAVLFSSRHCIFQFHNRSKQMFFAALYACSERGQKILQEGRVSIIRKFQREIDDSEILDFFVFLNGFSQQLLRKILRVSIASKEEADGIQNFRAISSVIRSADEHSKIVKFYQRVVVECSKESMHCSKDEVSFPLEDIIIDSDVKSNENMEVLGLCFGKYAQKLKSVCIRECTSSDEAKSILDWLKVTNISHLEKLELRSIPPGFILKLLLERSRDTLFCLDLCSFEFENASHIYRNKVSKFELEHIRKITQMKFLQVITLASLILRHTDMDLLLNFLSSKKEMRQIILYYVECIEQRTNNCNGHSLDVSLHANLHVFGLDRVPVTRIKMNSSNLEECWVGKLSSSILSQVFADLKSSEQLQTLYCLRHDDICAMLESLPKLHQLRYIYFREINFGNRVISLNSKNVKLVTLTGVTISSTALRLLLDSIEILVHEVDVCLENITVVDRQDFDKIKAILVGSPNFTIYFDVQNVRKQRVLKFRRVVTNSKNTSTNTFIVRSENL